MIENFKLNKSDWRNIGIGTAKAFAILTLMGLLSNVFALLLGYVVAVLNIFKFQSGFFMNLDDQMLWILYSAVTMLSCLVGGFRFFTGFGKGKANQQYEGNLTLGKTRVQLFTEIGFGTAIHSFLCILISKLGLSYLIFAPPVQYIARYLGEGDRAMFHDVAFDMTTAEVLLAVVIYTVLIVAAAVIGAIRGRRRGMEELLAEEEERLNTPPEASWSDEDENQLPSALVERQRERAAQKEASKE